MTHPANPDPIRLGVGPDEAGQRLDRLIADWRGLSRSAVLRLLDAGALTRNGATLKPTDKGAIAAAGDTIELDPQYAASEAPRPDLALALDVLIEAEGWVAVNKPPGVAVRPHALDEAGTVLNAIAARYPRVAGVGEGGLRSGVVHRLDNDTSGALLVALEHAAWLRLRAAFAEHRIDKRYLTLVHGSPPDHGDSTLSLRVAQHAPARVEVCDNTSAYRDARPCSLAWRVVERFGRDALVAVDLHTGFLHQVRVMMAHHGWPVIGDSVYGPVSASAEAPRQMLHAASLSVDDISVAAPLPDDFEQQITRLRNNK